MTSFYFARWAIVCVCALCSTRVYSAIQRFFFLFAFFALKKHHSVLCGFRCSAFWFLYLKSVCFEGGGMVEEGGFLSGSRLTGEWPE